MEKNLPLQNCTIAMAHPDDEVLWASSLLTRASKIILCFGAVPKLPGMQESRQRAVLNYPLSTVDFLDISEAGVFEMAGWPSPTVVEEGVEILNLANSRDHRMSAERYRENFERLCTTFVEKLAESKDVVTHNPWGEYGHEEHVQVFNAVVHAQKVYGFNIWVTNYVSNRSFPFMLKGLPFLGHATEIQKIDRVFAEEIKQIYCSAGCWTWFSPYIWPQGETFLYYQGNKHRKRSYGTYPLNVINLE